MNWRDHDGSRRASVRLDAEIALNAGDHRLALFHLCQYAGPPFTELWRFASDEMVSAEPPGALRLQKSRHSVDESLTSGNGSEINRV